jgi:hypothetical protein
MQCDLPPSCPRMIRPNPKYRQPDVYAKTKKSAVAADRDAVAGGWRQPFYP